MAAQIRHKLHKLDVVVTDGRGELTVTFFNQPFRRKQLHPGTRALFAGKVELLRASKRSALAHPPAVRDRPPTTTSPAACPDLPGVGEGAELEDPQGHEDRGAPDASRAARSAAGRPCACGTGCRRFARRTRSVHRPRTTPTSTPASKRLALGRGARHPGGAGPAPRGRRAPGRDAPAARAGGLLEAVRHSPAVRADTEAAGGRRGDRGRPGPHLSDAPAAAGRGRLGQDGRRAPRDAHRDRRRRSGRPARADRGARHPARAQPARAARARSASPGSWAAPTRPPASCC